MPQVDMKRKKKTQAEIKAMRSIECDYDGDRYPYGLKIHFNEDEINKIPSLKTVQAGETINIVATGKVIEVRVTDKDKGKNRHHVEIQIQSIDIPDGKNFKDAFDEAAKK